MAALENEEPAFRLFTDVFSRFIIHGTVQAEAAPAELADRAEQADRADTYVPASRKVTFADDLNKVITK